MTETTTMVHVRVNKKLRDDAMKEARNLGVSLSLVTEQAYRDFVSNKRLVVEKPLVPTPYLAKILREAEANKNNPDYWSPAFHTGDEAIAYLRKQMIKK